MRKKLLKRVLPLTLAVSMLIGNQAAFASSNNVIDKLQTGYTEIENRAQKLGVPFSMTFDEYKTAYDESGFESVQEYANTYLDIMEPTATPYSNNRISGIISFGLNSWYYNIGTSLPSNADPKYDTYHLYDNVKKGDIIFEANGGFGITAHVSIVEGKYYDAKKDVNYIRVIEAIGDGVVRSCLDDTRVNDNNVTVLRVSSATSTQINAAVSFCVGEVGSSYSLDFQKDTSSSETDWYCSELVWAAYKNQGIDTEVSGISEPGITPRDIKNSSKTSIVSFK